jgi:outer membrane protein
MKPTSIVIAAFVTTIAAHAQIGILHVQNAVLNTAEGHQALTAFESKYAAKRVDLDRRQADLGVLQDQLRKRGPMLSADAQRKLTREIDQKTKTLTRDAQDVQGEYDEEQAEITQALDRKFRTVVDKYAKDAGLALIIDIGNPQTPAYWWANTMDVTNEVIRAYDTAYPLARKPERPADAMSTYERTASSAVRISSR